MGPLANLFSTIDSAKRKFGGLLENPMGTFEQLMGQMQDYRRQDQQLGDQAFGDPRKGEPLVKDRQAFAQLGQRTFDNLMSFAPAGITVWHGSPHTFSKFDSSKIGTGEGAQAYGHGLYLAESPEVAEGYRKALSRYDDLPTTGPVQAAGAMLDAKIPEQRARDTLTQYLNVPPDQVEQVIAQAKSALAKGKGGALYKVDLPDEHVAKMLDWDAPIGQQPAEVRDAIANARVLDDLAEKLVKQRSRGMGFSKEQKNALLEQWRNALESSTGSSIYNTMSNKAAFGSPDSASARLREIGIPGIRYLDGGSRGAGGGTSNFVVFPGNEGLLTILERNGQPLR